MAKSDSKTVNPEKSSQASDKKVDEGKLKAGDSFVHESVIGSLFKCEIAEVTEVAGLPAIRPKVTGNACITGYATWILDPKDPFPEGFILD